MAGNGKSPFYMVHGNPIHIGKSPFYVGKSPFYIGKSPFYIGNPIHMLVPYGGFPKTTFRFQTGSNLDDNQAATHALEAGETYPTRKNPLWPVF